MGPQYKSFFQGTDPVENAEGAVEQSDFDNPSPVSGLDNKYHDMNPQVVGWHDVADAAQFRTNDDDVPNSPKGQGGQIAHNDLMKPPIG